jgi:hypothetical protein
MWPRPSPQNVDATLDANQAAPEGHPAVAEPASAQTHTVAATGRNFGIACSADQRG